MGILEWFSVSDHGSLDDSDVLLSRGASRTTVVRGTTRGWLYHELSFDAWREPLRLNFKVTEVTCCGRIRWGRAGRLDTKKFSGMGWLLLTGVYAERFARDFQMISWVINFLLAELMTRRSGISPANVSPSSAARSARPET